MQYRIHFNRPHKGRARHYYLKASSPEEALTRFLTKHPSADIEKVERLRHAPASPVPRNWVRAPFFV